MTGSRIAILCAVLVACSGDGDSETPAADAGGSVVRLNVGNILALQDAGAVLEDAGAQDAGVVLEDAGAQDAGAVLEDAGPAGCPEFEALTCEGILGNGLRCADCDGEMRCVCGWVLTYSFCAIVCE